MSIQTEYRGHIICWSDNEDMWTCYDLSDKVRSSPKLSNVKSAIDRMYLAERKSASVDCWEINSRSTNRTPSIVVEYLGAKEQRSWATNKVQRVDHRVAVVAKRSGSERPARRENTCDVLGRPGPEFDAAWDTYVTARNEAIAAGNRADEAYDALPRLTVDDVAALVALRERGDSDA